MTLDEIYNEWDKDAHIDSSNLANESLIIPKLHTKYYRMFSNERLLLRKIEGDAKVLVKLKIEYYNGSLDHETMKERGWVPNPLKILRTDIQTYIDADSDIINFNLRMAMQREKVDVLEAIVKTLNTRNFIIKNAIDYMRFTSGG